MNMATIETTIRTTSGKGAARKQRAEGLIPGVIYGKTMEPVSVSLNAHALKLTLQKAQGLNTKLRVVVKDGEKVSEYDALVKELQMNPVNDAYLHVDFNVLYPDVHITRTVPIKLEGKPIGVRQGGRLIIYRREVKIRCLPASFIHEIVVDINNMEGNQTLRIKDVKVPEGVSLIFKDNFAICHVKSAKDEEAAESAEAAAAAAKAAPPAAEEKKEEKK